MACSLGVSPLSAVLKTDIFYDHAWCERCLAHEVACMRVKRVLGYCRCEVCEGCLNATLSLSRLNSPDMEGRRQQHLLSCPHSEGMPPTIWVLSRACTLRSSSRRFGVLQTVLWAGCYLQRLTLAMQHLSAHWRTFPYPEKWFRVGIFEKGDHIRTCSASLLPSL